MNLLRLILILFCLCWLAFTANAQTVEPQKVCLDQEVANRCATLARMDAAKDEKIAALEESVKVRNKAIEDLKALNDANVAQLKDALHKTELELATKTGELIAKEAMITRLNAIVDVLLSRTRKKSIGLIAF